MKPSTLLASLMLAGAADAKLWAWCAKKGRCSDAKGVGPTYKCGQYLYDYYSIQTKRWSVPNDKTDTYWGQFIDCCHDAGKTSCYQNYGL